MSNTISVKAIYNRSPFLFPKQATASKYKAVAFVYRNTAKGGEPDMRQEIQWSG